ncbi:serpentine type 7TM GPCR chemoreceptor srd domain-containing protein [Ditylenchus destructor]|uniref:Serpentine type 7TM GPCR chemoreceptor srd domain-containing protein n=1 Tax=Ditylenchus destructor TaxID=166010 RepID=A0AAD4MJ04_9BILA|nr:serpentine type 7TM GPCR chemoreceptor srd domain-containing protein [Ditylenchus destructor]
MIPVGRVHEINCWLVVTVGTVLNALLIWLVLTKSVKEMKIYSKVLLQTCVIDLLMILLVLLIQPIYVVFEGYNVLLSNGLLKNASPPYNFILMLIWFFGACFSTISSCVPFIYRYLLLCRLKNLTLLTYFKLLLPWLFFDLIFVGGIICAAYTDQMRCQKLEDINNSLNLFLNGKDTDSILTLTLLIETRSIPWAITVVYIIGVEAVCYIIIVVCGLKIRHTVGRAQRISLHNPRIIEVNRQLNYVLAAQSLLPLLEMALSILCLLTSVLSNSSDDLYFISYATLFMHYKAVLNPLITILMIPPYRNFITRRKRIDNFSSSHM